MGVTKASLFGAPHELSTGYFPDVQHAAKIVTKNTNTKTVKPNGAEIRAPSDYVNPNMKPQRCKGTQDSTDD